MKIKKKQQGENKMSKQKIYSGKIILNANLKNFYVSELRAVFHLTDLPNCEIDGAEPFNVCPFASVAKCTSTINLFYDYETEKYSYEVN